GYPRPPRTEGKDHGVRPPRLHDGGPARHPIARDVEGRGGILGADALVRHVAPHREADERGEEVERQRGLLLGVRLLHARDSARPLHADLRGLAGLRLDGARSRAVCQQPSDPPTRRVHGPALPAAVRADGETVAFGFLRCHPFAFSFPCYPEPFALTLSSLRPCSPSSLRPTFLSS